MESIGAYLKRQRQMRNIRLEDVAQSTKISLKSLVALEADDLSQLPGYAFAKGFVRSYAKAIGLNADEVLLQLEEYVERVSKDADKGQKRRWSLPPPYQIKSWIYFIVFLTLVAIFAYFSSR